MQASNTSHHLALSGVYSSCLLAGAPGFFTQAPHLSCGLPRLTLCTPIFLSHAPICRARHTSHFAPTSPLFWARMTHHDRRLALFAWRMTRNVWRASPKDW
jgi:hypothetical protein